MKIKKIISAVLSVSVLMSMGTVSFAENDEELFSKTYDMTEIESDSYDSITLEEEVPDGDYIVTVTTGGEEASDANIYINGGERVRAYELQAGVTQKNEQPVVPKNGKITIEVLGENPEVSEITIEQLPDRVNKTEDDLTRTPTIYIAGDSTAQSYNYESAYPQTGWGQVLADYFEYGIDIENRSMAGRSSKSYDNDGRLDKILTEMYPGDYVFIQFGINDGAENKPERYISVEDYKTLIKEKYIGEVEKRGGIPVLMTATAASWWDDENNNFMESRADYADPTREIAEETGVKFIDVNRIMTDTWNAMDKNDVLAGYFICEPLESAAYPAGTDDHTHMKEKGARKVAELIAKAIPESVPELAQYLRSEEKFTDIEDHWGKIEITALADKGYVKGDGTGKFNPEGTVTRAEFLKMAMEACGIASHAYRSGECLDAAYNDWYCYYLQGALDKDLIPLAMLGGSNIKTTKVLSEATEDEEAVTIDINVYQSGSFNGDTPITREEMAAVTMNCLSYAMKNAQSPIEFTPFKNEGSGFADSDIYEGYINSVDAAYEYGLVTGMGDGTFRPKDTLTRAQAAAIINRVCNLLK